MIRLLEIILNVLRKSSQKSELYKSFQSYIDLASSVPNSIISNLLEIVRIVSSKSYSSIFASSIIWGADRVVGIISRQIDRSSALESLGRFNSSSESGSQRRSTFDPDRHSKPSGISAILGLCGELNRI